MSQQTLILAASGATGALYTQRLLRAMEAHAGVGRIYFTATKTAAAIAADELGVQGDGPLGARLLGRVSHKITEFSEGDLWAPIASGTVHTDGMVIAPCSAGTMGAIAAGLSRNLVQRAAEVCLKERRRLILLLREAPYHRIHLENMLRLTDAGAIIYPASPTFYDKPEGLTAAADQIAARLLDLLALDAADLKRWRET